MGKSIQVGFSSAIIALSLCAWLFFSRLPFATRETKGQPPASASPSAMTAAAVSTASPTPDQAESDAGQARRKSLQAESRELERARQKAEDDKKRAQKNTELMAALNAKLLDPNIKVPQTVSEAASRYGQDLADTAKFKKRWGDSTPLAGTPEAEEYDREQDGLMSQSAALLKFLTDEKNAALFKQPDSVARFQTESLAAALGLRDDQTQAINAALDGYYQQFFTQNLNQDAQPETGFDAWHQQRLALSKQAYAGVANLLTPDQAAAFHGIYPTAGIWMFNLSFGGVPGLTMTH